MHSSEIQQITQMSITMWVDREVFYPMKCYSAKKKKVPIDEVMYMYLRNIMVSQRSQTQTAINTQCMVLFIESSDKDKKWPIVTQSKWVVISLSGQGHCLERGTLGDNNSVSYLDLDGSYRRVYIWSNSLSYKLKIISQNNVKIHWATGI